MMWSKVASLLDTVEHFVGLLIELLGGQQNRSSRKQSEIRSALINAHDSADDDGDLMYFALHSGNI